MQVFVLSQTELKVRQVTSSKNLRYGSVWIYKLFEMINQGFKAQGRKHQVLRNFAICCRELGGLKVSIFCACVRSLYYVTNRSFLFRQQLRLLNFLSKIEELDVTEDDIASFFHETKPQTQAAASKIAAANVLDGSAIGPFFKKKPEQPTATKRTETTASKVLTGHDEADDQSESKTVDVCLEIISNWGHQEIAGITEV